jgi:alpha-L-fucosidase 2
VVDCAWENGKIVSYKIRALKPCKVKVRINGEVKEVSATAFKG